MKRLSGLLVGPAERVARFFHRIELKLRGLSRPRLSDDEQWAAWQEQIRRIQNETTYAFQSRVVFRAILEMFENAALQKEGGFVYEWIGSIYGRDQVLAVRRELDRDSEVVNLIQLMYQIVRRPQVVSRARYLTHFPPGTAVTVDEQHKQFDELCGVGPFIVRTAEQK